MHFQRVRLYVGFTAHSVMFKIHDADSWRRVVKKSACVIDIGSATLRIMAFRSVSGEIPRVYFNRSAVTNLMQTVLKDREIPREVLERNVRMLCAFLQSIPGGKPGIGQCIGTEALRQAGNSQVFLERMQLTSGYPARLLDRREEGILAWRGSKDLLTDEDLLVDVGGGSTEWIWNSGDIRVRSHAFGASNPVPGIDSADKLGKTARKVLLDHAMEIARSMQCDATASLPGKIVILGGSATTLAAIHYSITNYRVGCVHGRTLSDSAVHSIFHRVAGMTAPERESIFHLESGRGSLILFGAALILGILSALDRREFNVSEYGIPFGQAKQLLSASGDAYHCD